MPFIHIKIAGPQLDHTQTARLQQGITSLMAQVLEKDASLTAVLVEPSAPGGWSIGGQAQPRAAHIDATVSEGSNTAEQKARFIAQADALLREVLGSALPVVSYIVIHDLAKDSWGYGGLTQAARSKTHA